MRIGFLFIGAIALLSACSTSLRTQARAGTAVSPPEPYVRISTADSNLVELQIALRKFVPSRGDRPEVWLTGVVHLGESNYFAALQNHLDAQSLVLFEGIGGPAPPTHEASSARNGQPPNGTESRPVHHQPSRASFQSSMAASLGLVFQLEAIDYTSPHFRNSDLSVQDLRQLMSQARTVSGQEGAAQSFETLMQMMEGESLLDTILRVVMQFLGANPKLQGMSKLAVIETIAQMKGDPSQLKGLPPQMNQLLEVLVQKRNQKVLDDLKTELKSNKARKSIAIFYGTGHMPDLELRLRNELNYRPAEELWLTAFSVNLSKSGISQSEIGFIRAFVKREMDQLRTPQ
jgi:hypothetical protein